MTGSYRQVLGDPGPRPICLVHSRTVQQVCITRWSTQQQGGKRTTRQPTWLMAAASINPTTPTTLRIRYQPWPGTKDCSGNSLPSPTQTHQGVTNQPTWLAPAATTGPTRGPAAAAGTPTPLLLGGGPAAAGGQHVQASSQGQCTAAAYTASSYKQHVQASSHEQHTAAAYTASS